MKKLLSIALAVCMAAGCLFAFASCKKEETLTVYTEAGFAPFEYVKDGKIVGVDVEIMEKVGKKLGKKVVFENVAFDSIVDAVSAGKLTNVGAAGISITAARKEKVDFSNEYYEAKLYVIYPAAEAANLCGAAGPHRPDRYHYRGGGGCPADGDGGSADDGGVPGHFPGGDGYSAGAGKADPECKPGAGGGRCEPGAGRCAGRGGSLSAVLSHRNGGGGADHLQRK